jgi:flagellar biosynthesis/type III secretory pathway protein FliH
LLYVCLTTLLLCLSGCDRVDCEESPALQAAYQEGLRQAEVQNRSAFERGRQQGLSLTRAQGESEGYQAGYADGYQAGYDNGDYEGAYQYGYGLGTDDGLGDADACADGADVGYVDGWEFGDADGYAYGYELGFDDWYQPCSLRQDEAGPHRADEEDSADSEELALCRNRGLRVGQDPGAFARGRQAGIDDNPDYRAGFDASYPLGFDEGVAIGEVDAYDEGLAIGYAHGFDEGWQLAWLDCYDQAYPQGYEDGYDSGYQAGYDDGGAAGESKSGCS